ncbi:MAG: glycosyltransferase family 4 protein [Actinomycetota bacterium]|nr:glycosyltransferase family 4 protein [Actinomycetota bacterium]
MRILIWHGYLLGGTGSNVYTRALARAWSRAGNDVTVLCQDPHPERYDLGGAAAVRPQLDGPLPVFVLDRYDDARAELLTDMSESDRQRFVSANVEVLIAQGPADLLFVNHVLLGAPVGAASGLPYVVKAHGSELEFAMRGRDDLCQWAAATLTGATAILAGSEHIVSVLDELVAPDRSKVHVVPPGVDIDDLRPADRASALAALVDEAGDDPPNPPKDHDVRQPDAGNAERLATFLAGERKTVLYVGKLSAEKGVSLLIDAVAGLDARCVVVGFGPARPELEASSGEEVLFTGPLEHRHLKHLWPLADVSVTPSIFPEAFGMVAAEAAACGSPPLVARHSGLAEIAAGVEAEYPVELRHLAAFDGGDVDDLRRKLTELLALPDHDWRLLSAAARRAVERRWSWTGIAQRVLDLAGAR